MKKFFRYILHSLGIMAIIVAICAIVNELRYSSSYLDPVGQILSNFTMTDSYFQTENDKSDKEADLSSEVMILDLAQCYSRADIAAGIEYLNQSGAKVIALDVIFGGAGDGDSIANDSLEHVVSRCKNVIAACRMVPSYDPLAKVAAAFEEDPELQVVYGDNVWVNGAEPHKVIRYANGDNYNWFTARCGVMPPHATFFVRKENFEKYGD